MVKKQLLNKISLFFNPDGTSFGGILGVFRGASRESLRHRGFDADLTFACFAFTLALEHLPSSFQVTHMPLLFAYFLAGMHSIRVFWG